MIEIYSYFYFRKFVFEVDDYNDDKIQTIRLYVHSEGTRRHWNCKYFEFTLSRIDNGIYPESDFDVYDFTCYESDGVVINYILIFDKQDYHIYLKLK